MCPYCFARQVRTWLNEKRISKETIFAIEEDLRKITNHFDDKVSEVRCVICGSERVSLCTFCFINKVYRILHKHLGKTEVLHEFEEIFNKDLWRVYE